MVYSSSYTLLMSERTVRKLAAIVAVDVAGYSRLVGRDEEGTLASMRAHRKELIDPLLVEYGGRIANTAGDSLLLEFPSVVEAVRCSIAVQKGIAERNREINEDEEIRFRVGIHLVDRFPTLRSLSRRPLLTDIPDISI